MSNRGLAVLGLRLFALFLLYHSLTVLPELYQLVAARGAAPSASYYYLALIAHLGPALLGLLIWVFVGRWVDLILPQRTAAPSPSMSVEEWQTVAFAAVGMLVVLNGLPDLAGAGFRAWQLAHQLDILPPPLIVALVVAALRVALGLALLASSRRLSGFCVYLRRLGVTA